MTVHARALRLIGERRAALSADGTLALDAGTLEATTVSAMVSDGLLARIGDTVARTAEGRMALRRALAEVPDDAFAAQHRVPVMRVIAGEAVVENAAESPLAWLATRKDKDGRPMLSPEEVEAGRRLAADYARGHQRSRVTQSWDVSGVRGDAPRDRMSVAEAAVDARRRTELALSAVGPGLAEVLFSVCCEEIGLEAVEKKQRWPARSGKVVLRLALQRLAVHYGLGEAAVGGPARALVQWGAADYRPAKSVPA